MKKLKLKKQGLVYPKVTYLNKIDQILDLFKTFLKIILKLNFY